MLFLHLLQLAHEPVVLGVRCRRGVEDVVLVVRAFELFPEPFSSRSEVVMDVRQVWSGDATGEGTICVCALALSLLLQHAHRHPDEPLQLLVRCLR